MTPLFCLRLAWGMAAALLLLSPAQVNPRFYRVQFQVTLGLGALAAVFLLQNPETDSVLLGVLGSSLFLSFLGSVVWSLHGAPGGRVVMLLNAVAFTAALALTGRMFFADLALPTLLTVEFSSALVLGMAMTAMLMGHSYLIAPSMSMTPLLRLLAALSVAMLLRGVLAGLGVWSWTAEHSLTTLNDVTLMLPVRWLLGFIIPGALCWMAWQAARIRSTQSATGILYAVVFCCFVGELTSQLLLNSTRLPL